MTACIALRHVPFESTGLLGEVLARRNVNLRVIDVPEAGVPSADARDADLLVILGGPIGVGDASEYPFLRDELDVIALRLSRGRPTLGICLGAQLIAAAAGARVYPGTAKEIGWSKLTLAEDVVENPLSPVRTLPVLHWHGDTYDLPADAELLASTAVTPNQAYRIGKHTVGLQFHLEVEAPALESWYVGHTSELSQWGKRTIGDLRREGKEQAPALREAALKSLGLILEAMGL